MNKQISQAPNYQIDENGKITNIAKKNEVFPEKNGNVRLFAKNGKRQSFKISDLMAECHPELVTSISIEEKGKKDKVVKIVSEKKAKTKLGVEKPIGVVKEIFALYEAGKTKEQILALNKYAIKTVQVQYYAYKKSLLK